MTPQFTINFRREVYQREQARARARVILLGVWVAYFGVMAVILGLYGLNAAAYARRTGILERQAVRLQERRGTAAEWTLSADDIGALTERARSLARHRGVLTQLGRRLPPNVRLASVAWNTENLSGAGAPRLVLSGTLRPEDQQDRMRSVVGLVSTLSTDSVIAGAFRNVKLASTNLDEGTNVVEFVIECQ